MPPPRRLALLAVACLWAAFGFARAGVESLARERGREGLIEHPSFWIRGSGGAVELEQLLAAARPALGQHARVLVAAPGDWPDGDFVRLWAEYFAPDVEFVVAPTARAAPGFRIEWIDTARRRESAEIEVARTAHFRLVRSGA